VAAPTAGLHFTTEVLAKLRERGVETAEVTLHVGTGTFRPVETEYIEQHPMHAEWCSIDSPTTERVLAAKREGRRVIAIGTTSARTLESFAQAAEQGSLPASLATRILITPGYTWRWVDGMVTNFHLPRSTLMAMVAARISPEPGVGVARLQELYATALREGYRFYSFGDAMLIV
jgi:S-adenosylmethionine:tRNA ribosyltransferase-isomerase